MRPLWKRVITSPEPPSRRARVEPLDVPHLAGRVVLGHEPERLRLDPQVDVLLTRITSRSLRRAAAPRRAPDPVVRLAEREACYPRASGLAHLEEEAPAAFPERQPLGERSAVGERVELANELARLELMRSLPRLKRSSPPARRRERDVVLVENIDAGVIEEDDVGVDHEELLHLSSLALPGGRTAGASWTGSRGERWRRWVARGRGSRCDAETAQGKLSVTLQDLAYKFF